jgi:DNA-directed RNA polymerase omega subunit
MIMYKPAETINKEQDNSVNNGPVQEIDSKFRLIIIAVLRNKQLRRGAKPLIEAAPQWRKSTNIAIEEAKRGLIKFILIPEESIWAQASLCFFLQGKFMTRRLGCPGG